MQGNKNQGTKHALAMKINSLRGTLNIAYNLRLASIASHPLIRF